ncbi:DUF92 domain-containing protein [Rubrobacter indicoceani]|uniref:DUF92 domain-containing protein n=1 Tax=Rubrobacter indicoceani TaxID=2051957 RepID=UPI000E5A3B04|nr:DUF92 domain-containing protein [Rubrobacter indicoceani]
MSLATAAIVTAAFAVLAHRFRMVGSGGALGGFALGTAIFYWAGWQGFVLLALFVVGGSALTRLGYEKKKRSGTAQELGGRRGAKNALANLSVAGVLAGVYAATGAEALLAAFVASLGAAFADTVESEVGQLYGGTPHLITSLQRVAPGTDGAVTVVGTLAGVVAAFFMAAAGLGLGLVDGLGAALVVAFAAFAGTLADSVIGAKLPRLGNELTNILCTLVAGLLAVLVL